MLTIQVKELKNKTENKERRSRTSKKKEEKTKIKK